MLLSAAKLRKLGNRSARELWVRGRQETAKLAERLPGGLRGEMSNRMWLRELHPASRCGSAEASAAFILDRMRTSGGRTFFRSLARRSEIVALMNSRFAAERLRLIDHADRICSARFDLLGLSNLSFGDPIDWRLEPISGKRTPLVHWSQIDFLNSAVAGDKKVTWELNRHQFLVTLGQAHWLTGDERYAASFIGLVSSWMDANPPKLGINWASSLEVALRSIAWLWALHLLADSNLLTEQLALRLLKSLTTHGRHIETYLSHYHSPNTHLTGEALGLFYLGTALPELSRAQLWRNLGLRILLDQLPIHVRPDGVYFEQSSYYHRYTTDFYTHLLLLAKATDTVLPRRVEEKLMSLLDHLMWITRPDGTSPFYGDDDGGRVIVLGERRADDFRDTLATGAALFSRGDWKFVAGQAAVETLWLLGPEGVAQYEDLRAEQPSERARAFAAGGYFVARDGWTEKSAYVLIKCGPHGILNCGHAHADALSFEFASCGVNWIVDPGTYTYTGNASARDQFRSSRAHNTVSVDGTSQSLPHGPFAWSHVAVSSARTFRISDECLSFEGDHDGYHRLPDPVTHERSVTLHSASSTRGEPAYLHLRDVLRAQAVHRYELRFHFSADCHARTDRNYVRVTSPHGEELILVTCLGRSYAGAMCVPARMEPGWISRGYAHREPCTVAVMEIEGQGLQEFTTYIVPVSADHDLESFFNRRAEQTEAQIEDELIPADTLNMSCSAHS